MSESIWKRMKLWIYSLQISVEPLIFVLAACNTARSIVTPGLSENKMMRVYPPPSHLSVKELKKFYNKKMVMWDNNYEYVNLPIACIVGVIYGGYSDYYGRKLPLLIGIASLLVENAMKILIWSPTTDWPLEWFFPTAALAGLLGDFLLTMSCINAYIADKFEDKAKLSIRMIVVSIMFSLGSLLASRCTVALSKSISRIVLLCITEGLILCMLIGGILFLSRKPPKKRRLLVVEESEYTERLSTFDLTKLSFCSIYESAKLFVVPRDGHKRLFIYLCFLANFLDQFVFGEEKSLLGNYTRLPPFNWDTLKYAEYKSWRPIVQIAGMLFGVVMLKKLLKLRDTTIICLAIASMGISVLIIGLAQASWLIYASLLPGSLHGLLNPLTYTFMSYLVEPNEIGKAFAISSITQKLAGFFQTVVLQNIYIATLNWYQGFVWILMAFISFVATVIYGIIHVIAKEEKIE